jgi:hypothetical protein
LPPDDEQALQEAISNIGPVTVAFAASEKFKHYYSGVFTDTTCTDDINHGGLLGLYIFKINLVNNLKFTFI